MAEDFKKMEWQASSTDTRARQQHRLPFPVSNGVCTTQATNLSPAHSRHSKAKDARQDAFLTSIDFPCFRRQVLGLLLVASHPLLHPHL